MEEATREPTPEPVAFHTIVIALSGAVLALLCLVSSYLADGISEKEESRIFVLGSVLAPLAGMAAARAVDGVRRRYFPRHPFYYPGLATCGALFWATAIRYLHGVTPQASVHQSPYQGPLRSVLLAWVALHVVVLLILAATRGWTYRGSAWSTSRRACDRLLPFLCAAVFLPFVTKTAFPGGVLALLALAGCASVFHEELGRFPSRALGRHVFDAIVIAGIALVLIDAALDANVHHYNFYLGPVSAVRGGRSMLVDVNCQYGVGIIYFLAGVFDLNLAGVQPTIFGFAIIIGVLSVVQCWVVYGTLRAITRSPFLAAVIAVLMVAVTRFGPMEYPSSYPSTGGLRFLPGFLLVGLFAVRPRWPRLTRVLEVLVVGGASIWSFESFVYVFAAFVAGVLYEAFHVRHRSDLVRLIGRRILPAALAVTGFHLFLAVYTRLRAGEWPHWSRYTDYIVLYSTQEFGTLPIETWTPWIFVVGVYAVTFIALGYRRLTLGNADQKPAYLVLFAMSALGVAQFTYYVGRSHPHNLFHVASPAFLVAGYWFIVAADQTRYLTLEIRKAVVFVCYAAFAYLGFTAMPELARKYEHSWLFYLVAEREWPKAAPSARTTDAMSLIRTYAPDARQVPLFTSTDLDVEIMLALQRTNFWPLSYSVQDALIPETRRRILATNAGLGPGAIIFVDVGVQPKVDLAEIHLVSGVEELEQAMFNELVGRYRFELVEARPSGMLALRLVPR